MGHDVGHLNEASTITEPPDTTPAIHLRTPNMEQLRLKQGLFG